MTDVRQLAATDIQKDHDQESGEHGPSRFDDACSHNPEIGGPPDHAQYGAVFGEELIAPNQESPKTQRETDHLDMGYETRDAQECCATDDVAGAIRV